MATLRVLERLGLSLNAAFVSVGQSFHTFVFAAYPVMLVVGSTAATVPLDWVSVARCLIVSVALTAMLLVVLRPLISELPHRAACLSFFFIIAFCVFPLLSGNSTHPGVAAIYTVVSGTFAALIVRPWRHEPRKSTGLNLAACTLLAFAMYNLTPALNWAQPWRPTADALIEGVVASSGVSRAGPQPDIYYVILDGFGRPDVLRELYTLDLDPFVRALELRGFAVPTASQSNYAQTYLSIASSLNLSYLGAIESTMRNSSDRRVLNYLIQNNALMRVAKRAGYQVTAIGSNYSATVRLESADVCLCEQYGLSETEVAVINLTPFRALPLRAWTYDAHRRKFEETFRHLHHAARQPGPKLIFAHVLSPHPPFIFEHDGRSRPTGNRMFSFRDGSHFHGSRAEYVDGYRGQAQFVAKRVLDLIDTILQRPGPSPVIVVHGDHGPGSTWEWGNLERTDTRERLGIFSAYRFPGNDNPALATNITPVNGLRVMANRHLGTSLAALPDVSFASSWELPYNWVLTSHSSGGQDIGEDQRRKNPAEQ